VANAPDPELVIGLVTPVGTNTTELADRVKGALADYAYKAIVIKLSDHLPSDEDPPLGEPEDRRVLRLIAAGDAFCKLHATDDEPAGDPAALARLAVREIRRTRVHLAREDGDEREAKDIIEGRPRTAYILHSLKRPAEIRVLREIYGGQFLLIGSQGTVQQREANLRQRALSSADEVEQLKIIQDLMRRDGDEREPVGQRVNEAYPLADFFLRDNEVSRIIRLLFGEPIAPETGEYAMYLARASSARSLAASRKVGAAIVVGDAVISTGFNDAPHGQRPDVEEGVDTSERFKQDNVLDTVRRLRDAGLLNAEAAGLPDLELAKTAIAALKGGDLLGVIEYQRAVHAEAHAVDDATVRGVSPSGGTLYVTTYPCHLCYKHALSVRISRVEYIEPYTKSRAAKMYPDGSAERLIPFAGVAPRRYIEIFEEREPFLSDASGRFVAMDRSVAQPLLGRIRDDDDRAKQERLAVNGLKQEYR
jgi:deoxycytidylate deaminase